MSAKEKLRESFRFPTYLKAYYYLDGIKEGFDVCNVSNISYGGICIKLHSNKKIKIGAGINLGLIYKWKTINIKGVFRWTRKVRNYYVGGIELTKALDVCAFIKCYYGNTAKKEKEDHCSHFIKAFCCIRKYLAKNKRTIKDVNYREKVSRLIDDFRINALEKIGHIENELDCLSNDFNKIFIALNNVNEKLIQLKNAKENLEKKSFVTRSFMN